MSVWLLDQSSIHHCVMLLLLGIFAIVTIKFAAWPAPHYHGPCLTMRPYLMRNRCFRYSIIRSCEIACFYYFILIKEAKRLEIFVNVTKMFVFKTCFCIYLGYVVLMSCLKTMDLCLNLWLKGVARNGLRRGYRGCRRAAFTFLTVIHFLEFY